MSAVEQVFQYRGPLSGVEVYKLGDLPSSYLIRVLDFQTGRFVEALLPYAEAVDLAIKLDKSIEEAEDEIKEVVRGVAEDIKGGGEG